MLYITANSTPI